MGHIFSVQTISQKDNSYQLALGSYEGIFFMTVEIKGDVANAAVIPEDSLEITLDDKSVLSGEFVNKLLFVPSPSSHSSVLLASLWNSPKIHIISTNNREILKTL